MIARVNFFREKSGGLSYRKMAQISAVLLALVGAVFFLQNLKIRRLEKQAAFYSAEIERIKTGKGMAKGQLDPVQTLTALLMQEPCWNEALLVISQSLSNGISLETLKGKIVDDGAEIDIQGTAYQTSLVPALLTRLRGYKIFSRVHLISTETTGNVDVPYRFKLKGKLDKTL